MLNVKARQDIARKLRVLSYAKSCGNVAKTCRYFGIARQTFYSWKMTFERHGEQGLINMPGKSKITYTCRY